MSDPVPSVARVLCDASGPDRSFDYRIPDGLRDRVLVGSVVRVDLHGRRIGGWVIALDPPDALESERLLPIRHLTGRGPSADVIALTQWAAHRWAGRPSHFMRAASPPRAIAALPSDRRSGLRPEPRSPATTRLLAAGGGVLRLPPGSDVIPAVWSCVDRGRLLVVVPGADDAVILAGRIRRAGLSVAVWPDEWDRAAAGVDVIVGARSAAFATVSSLDVVLLIDEHDERLQSESAPTWHAREVLSERSRLLGIPVVMTSAVPTPEARLGRQIEAPPRQREVAAWPKVDVVDPATHEGPASGRVSSEVLEEIRHRDRRVLCVLNTSGRSSLLACRGCRELARCAACASVLVQETGGDLVCRRCGERRPPICAECGGTVFINLRPGAARFARELGAATTRDVQLLEGDALPSWSTGGTQAPAEVIIGSEAVLHRVRAADTVVFLDIDAELLAPRFRAGQQVLSLVARAAALVGDRRRGGRIIVQTRTPEHPLLAAIASADPGTAGDIESSAREMLHLPPFGALAVVEGAGARDFAATLPDSVRVGGDGDRLQVRAADTATLADALAQARRPTKGRLRVAVDPAR